MSMMIASFVASAIAAPTSLDTRALATFGDKSNPDYKWAEQDAALSEELEAQLAANPSQLNFYWVNQAANRCGEVDAAPYMPKDLFEPSHKLGLLGYVYATISLFGIPSGPQPGELKLGRCKDN